MIELVEHLFGVDRATAEAVVLIVFGVIGIRADILLQHIAHSLDKLILLCVPKIAPQKVNHQGHHHTVMMAHQRKERE